MPILPYERKTSDIHISDQLRSILEIFCEKSEVASLLLHKRLSKDLVIEDHVNYICVSKNDTTKISYLPVDRISKVEQSDDEDYWTTSKRIACKPGSFISKILKDISPKEVENFASLYKTFATQREIKFEVVTGEDIRKYYQQDTYLKQNGSLGASCMKGDGCQQFMDIYTQNPIISMLILLGPEDKVMGRALLWNFDDKKVMDRIYTISDEEYQAHFMKWATDNGYLHREYQNWANSIEFVDGKTPLECKFDVQLKVWDFTSYPYLDTFKWLDMETGIIYNYRPDHFLDDTRNKNQRVLSVACGTFEYGDYMRFDEVDRGFAYRGDIVQLECGIFTTTANARWSETFDAYILRSDSKYSKRLEDYIYTDISRNPEDKVIRRLEYVKRARGVEDQPESLKDRFFNWITTQQTEWIS
jgi:hypothetical protein